MQAQTHSRTHREKERDAHIIILRLYYFRLNKCTIEHSVEHFMVSSQVCNGSSTINMKSHKSRPYKLVLCRYIRICEQESVCLYMLFRDTVGIETHRFENFRLCTFYRENWIIWSVFFSVLATSLSPLAGMVSIVNGTFTCVFMHVQFVLCEFFSCVCDLWEFCILFFYVLHSVVRSPVKVRVTKKKLFNLSHHLISAMVTKTHKKSSRRTLTQAATHTHIKLRANNKCTIQLCHSQFYSIYVLFLFSIPLSLSLSLFLRLCLLCRYWCGTTHIVWRKLLLIGWSMISTFRHCVWIVVLTLLIKHSTTTSFVHIYQIALDERISETK